MPDDDHADAGNRFRRASGRPTASRDRSRRRRPAFPPICPFCSPPGSSSARTTSSARSARAAWARSTRPKRLDSGRRIALKLLSRGLGDDEERERFLREGRLAASLSHPNCVYVFGTSEIQGFPVIAMELVPHGTLKDLVVPGSPMTAAAAVDAILQVDRRARRGGVDRHPAPRRQAVELLRASRRPRARRRFRPVGRHRRPRRGRPARSSARRVSRRRSSCAAIRSTSDPTSIPSARRSSTCSPAVRPSTIAARPIC